jgi:cysteine-rich repeat protein
MRRLAGVLFVVVSMAARPASGTVATDLCPAAADPCEVTTSRTVTPGSTLDFGVRALLIRPTGKLVVSGGPLAIRAGSVHLEANGEILGLGGSNGSNVDIRTAGDIRMDGGGSANSRLDVSASLNPGQVDLVAGGNVLLNGFLNSNSTTEDGGGGVVNITATGDVSIGGALKLKGGNFNLGGFLTVVADDATVSGLVDASAADGGIIEFSVGNTFTLAAAGRLVLKGGGGFGDAGELDVFSHGNITVAGEITATGAGNYTSGGGTGADILMASDTGAITFSAPVFYNGAPPDGEGGEMDLDAATDITQTGTLFGHGNGIDTCGGSLFAVAGRRLSLGSTIRVDGGSCGGGFLVLSAGELASIGAVVDASGSGGGGALELSAGRISLVGKVNLSATTADGLGGQSILTACQIDTASGSLLQANGGAGRNRLRVGGALTVGGTISATPVGQNLFEYRDPAMPPVVLGSGVVSPAATLLVDPTLPVCAIGSAVCGNGATETGETCDDGNVAACDGCSPTCRTEGCGNHVIECTEECDDGAANGTPGDGCSATCQVIETSGVVLKPGKRVGAAACFLEWALHNPQEGTRLGFPANTQSCIDGDLACDADGIDNGACAFRTAACLAPIDPRIPGCQPTAIASAQLRKPNPFAPRDTADAVNNQALRAAFAGLGIRVTYKDTVLQTGVPNSTRGACSADFYLIVPHPPGGVGTRLVKAGATDVLGRRMRSNRLALVCQPNPSICGNGAVEITETCDDGNTAACDGCSDHCRVEACGNGVIECGEDCDDGAFNGQPGSGCTPVCTEAPPALRIPGGRRATECASEWSMKIGSPALLKTGLPHIKQSCVDDDPTCDFDPAPGTCRFHVWMCVGGADTRLACPTTDVDQVELLRPSASQVGFGAAARTAFLGALDRLTLPASGGERCSGRASLDVPAGKSKLALRARAHTPAGTFDKDTLKLTCIPRSG